MYDPSLSAALTDPNVNRFVQETISNVEDVERRLQTLKIGIAQSFPQLAPSLQIKELQNRDQTSWLLARAASTPFSQGIPYGQPIGALQGLPSVGGIPPHMLGISPYGQSPYVAQQFGQTGGFSPVMGGSPFQGVPSFRPW